MKFTKTSALLGLAGSAAASSSSWASASTAHPFAQPSCSVTSTVLVTETTTATVYKTVDGASGWAGGAKGTKTITITSTLSPGQVAPTGAGGWGSSAAAADGSSAAGAWGSSAAAPAGSSAAAGWGSSAAAPAGSSAAAGWGSSAAAADGSSAAGGWGSTPAGSTPAAPAGSSAAGGWGSSAAGADGTSAAGGWASSPAAPAGSTADGSKWSVGSKSGLHSAATSVATSAGAVGGNGGNGGNGGKFPWGSGPGGIHQPGNSYHGPSAISTLTDSFTLTTSVMSSTTSHPAPTYSTGTNVTSVSPPTAVPTTCNSATDRGTWCNGLSIDTDYTTTFPSTGKTCSYSLYLQNTTCNFDGTNRECLGISDGVNPATVPGPTIECNWGDNIVITVYNQLEINGTAIHWHGIRQLGTNPNDGVPGITECALAPGQSRVYSFKATQYGSTWYHSHYAAQYGDGVRGAIIIHGPATANYDVDMGAVMVDDLFAVTVTQMNSLIAHFGPLNPVNYLFNGINTSPDLSTGKHAQWTVEQGKTYRFRIINSAAMNSWWMHFDNHNMTVIATDLVPIVPYTTDWLAITTGQRYDVLITANQPIGNYFFRAVTQLSCPASTTNNGLGAANGIISYKGGNSTLLPTSTYGNRSISSFATCQDEPLASLVPYLSLGAGNSTAFTASAQTLPGGNVSKVVTADDGAVFRWFLNGNGFISANWTQPTLESLAQGNNNTISNAVFLPQTSVQWVYFVIQNVLGASHPMHLHGHDFSLLGQGNGVFTSSMVSTLNFVNPPRRDTAMLLGGATLGYTVIGFQTDNPGAWLMHCHIIWHADGGLALQFIERQDKIPAVQWTQNSQFQDQCAAYEAFQATGLGIHTSGSSGLRRSIDEPVEDVVRRSDKSEKRYLDNVAARGLGDGYKPRHVVRR